MMGIALATRGYIAATYPDVSLYFNQLPAYLDTFALGMAAALAHVRLSRVKHGAAMRLVCSAATVAALWLLWRTARAQAGCATTEAIRLGQMNRRLAMGLLGAMLLVASANAGWVVRHILSNPVTRFVSSVSMQFYIWHQTLAVWLLRARIIPSVSATPNYDGELLWQKRYTFVCFAAALLLAAAFALRGACLNYVTDDYRNFLSVWVDFFRTHGGLAALRAPVGNYNVPYLTVLALISGSSLPDLHLIKLFSILFDVVLAWSVMQLVGLFRRGAAWKLAAFFLVLFWPTVVLNGALWGQCDSVYAALAVLSVYLVLSGHPLLGVVSIGASFAFKLQAVFVMPVFLLFWLTRRVKLRHALAFPAVCVVMVLPAVIAGRGLWDALTIPFQQTGSIGTGLNYNSPSVFALFRDVTNPDAAARLGIGAAALVIAALAVWFWLHRDDCSDRALLLAAAVLAAAIPFFLPHMHDRYFFAADALTLALAAAWPQLALPALLCEFASLLGYHAYLRMRYLLPMADGALALIAALAILTVVLVTETRQSAAEERKMKKST